MLRRNQGQYLIKGLNDVILIFLVSELQRYIVAELQSGTHSEIKNQKITILFSLFDIRYLHHPIQSVLSRLRYWMASLRCWEEILSDFSISAIVRDTLRMRS